MDITWEILNCLIFNTKKEKKRNNRKKLRTDEEAMEECFLLAFFPWLAHSALL